MNRYIIVGIIALVFLGIGGYFYTQNKQNTAQHGGGSTEHPTEAANQPAAQSSRSYELEVTSSTDNIKPNQPVNFKFMVKNDKGEIFKNYEIAHEKIMHFIVVRKDLQQFQHIHPDFNQGTGEFSVQLTFPTDGPYRVFPDFTPGEENPQKLPVTLNKDINVGNMSKYSPKPVAADTNPTKTVDGYAITYKLNPQQPKTQSDFTYTLTVASGGQPVTNLETYLGALGHSVILKEGTLDFIHTHAGEASAGSTMEHGAAMENAGAKGPDINFSTTFPESGIYKIFTQFQHQGKVNTTDYVINVQ